MKRGDFSDEILMAYADGELDADTRLALDAAMADDEELAGRVAMFADTRRIAKEAFAPMLKEPVPQALEDRVRAMLAAAPSNAATESNVVEFRKPASPAGPAPRQRWHLPLAASIALVAGLTGGYLIGQPQQSAPSGVRIAMLDNMAIAAALGSVPAGESRPIESAGQFKAIASFRDGGGQLCREFEFDAVQGSALVAVACNASGSWEVRFAVATAQADNGYAPASSLEALEAYLGATGAGEPMAAADEAAALKALR